MRLLQPSREGFVVSWPWSYRFWLGLHVRSSLNLRSVIYSSSAMYSYSPISSVISHSPRSVFACGGIALFLLTLSTLLSALISETRSMKELRAGLRAGSIDFRTGSIGSINFWSGSIDSVSSTLTKTLSVSSFEDFKESNRGVRVDKFARFTRQIIFTPLDFRVSISIPIAFRSGDSLVRCFASRIASWGKNFGVAENKIIHTYFQQCLISLVAPSLIQSARLNPLFSGIRSHTKELGFA